MEGVLVNINELPDLTAQGIFLTPAAASGIWQRVYVTQLNGGVQVSLGRLQFCQGLYTHAHWYKKEGYRQIDSSDYVACCWEYWLLNKKPMSYLMFQLKKARALNHCRDIVEAKRAARLLLPNQDKQRPRLVGPNPRRVLMALVRGEEP